MQIKKKKTKLEVVNDSSSDETSDDLNLSDHSSDGIDSDSDDYCKVCGGYYHDKHGPKVDWICCTICKKWLHETCTSQENTCDGCLQK